jgi:hypothetical protein
MRTSIFLRRYHEKGAVETFYKYYAVAVVDVAGNVSQTPLNS